MAFYITDIVAKPIRNLFRKAETEIVYNKLVAPYFSNTYPKIAVTATTMLHGATVGGSVYFNYLWKDVYNHLAGRDFTAFWHHDLPTVAGAAAGVIAINLVQFAVSQTLHLSWSNWAQKEATQLWLAPENQSKLVVTNQDLEPEQRIASDIGTFVNGSQGLTFGLLSNVANLGAFSYVLWSVSPKLFAGTLALGAMGTWTVHRAGKSLSKLNDESTAAQNAYRNSIVAAKTNLQSIASWRGEAATQYKINEKLEATREISQKTNWANFWVNGVQWSYQNIASIFPYMLIVPDYAKPGSKMGIGDVNLGVSASYNQRFSLDWYGRNQQNIINWMQAAKRLTKFLSGCNPDSDLAHKFPQNHADGALALSIKDLILVVPKNGSSNGGQHVLCQNVSLEVPLKSGDRLLLSGPSGCGKSTLYNILGGVKPHEIGEISCFGIANRMETMFVPQGQYLPDGNLREELSFPQPKIVFSDEQMIAALEKVGLGHKVNLLQEEGTKGTELGFSGGELQRLNFARLLLHKPKIIGLDEATSALPPEDKTTVGCDGVETSTLNAIGLHQLLFDELPDSIIVSISHQQEIRSLHNVTGTFSEGQITFERSEPVRCELKSDVPPKSADLCG